MATGSIAESFRAQAAACRRLGSPFTARLCGALAEVLDRSTGTGHRVVDWRGDPVADALPLRLCAGLHALVRSGGAPELARVYPPHDASDPALKAALGQALEAHDHVLAGWLDNPPRTNEVGRSTVLMGGLQTIADETGLALQIYEIGAAAGLNLLADHWDHDLGHGRRWGPANAPLTIACAWRGALPPLKRICIAGRAGSDVEPLDPADPADRERLIAYIWADQAGRIARAEAALDHAARHGAPVERADAADWVEARLAESAPDSTCRVLMHSIMWQYLSSEAQRRITMAMVVQGVDATPQRPVAWLRMEADGDAETAAVILTSWPGGKTRELGRADYHGRFVDWSREQ